jgi:hypothetical protein
MGPPSKSNDPAYVVATRFSGCIVRCDLPRIEVTRSLPAALRLGRVAGCADDRHPVVFVFGEHDRSALLFASLTLPTGVRFYETVIAIPSVHSGSDASPALFLPRVFSGEPVVTWSGNAHYGFAKRLVPMEWLGDTFVVSDEKRALLAHVIVGRAHPWERAATSRLGALRGAIELGRTPVFGCREDGNLVRSQFLWDFDEAWIRPIDANVSIDAPLCDGLVQPGGAGVDGLEVSGLGWRLSWPEP